MKILGAILAGGGATRFGSDKAAALLDGEAGALTGITITDVESLLAPISSLAETPDTR